MHDGPTTESAHYHGHRQRLRDRFLKSGFAGLQSPQAAAKKAKTTVADVIKRYRNDGFPGKRGGKRNAGAHCDGEADRCEVLLEYFNGTAAAEDLDQDGLDEYHTWRCKKVAQGFKKKNGKPSKPKGVGDRTTDLDLNCLNNA